MAAQAHSIGVSPSLQPHTGHRRLRAVVADDKPDMRETTVALLEWDSCVDVVGTSDNGAMAVELVEILAPDLAVLDINMPKMTGLEATRRIKQISPQTKVLVISADDHPDVALCALDSGADAFLWKGDLAKQCQAEVARMFTE
jgi:DNA-binding NarL/FixJ family response regulator